VAWLGVTLFAFQIYFDFSGYSDIAIGSAYILCIRLPWNFRTPYLSVGPREFWQRWHISLSTWIRDYLFSRSAAAAVTRRGPPPCWSLRWRWPDCGTAPTTPLSSGARPGVSTFWLAGS
jgi:hypothetical protein